MKKLLAFLLAAILIFSLAACGSNDSYAKYEELYQYLEAKDYDSAVAYIQDLAGTVEDAPATEETVPSTEEPSYTTVEITLDNWQDYFEVQLVASENRNAFGELVDFVPCYCLRLKDEWEDSVVALDLAIESSASEGNPCWYEYNMETGEIVRGEHEDDKSKCGIQSGFAWPGEAISLTREHLDFPEEGSLHAFNYEGTFVIEGNIARVLGETCSDLTIARIQGTLTIKD